VCIICSLKTALIVLCAIVVDANGHISLHIQIFVSVKYHDFVKVITASVLASDLPYTLFPLIISF
jgi:hypothetical protein